ncbi:hypothetical protein J2S00_001915 [Caldalkalibacillus uzonensis]|uniref:DUF3055 domain-containing protein n=1 Tax=Caldalkalibacillus uzonensis TaxID=353224 RepID=A0ABU0CRT1_9BACI|nr:DUF3055 domain-containing protein [Caldalkalibacillus uzonensis]MDQ0339129.1 hypothetical protein [Caldalkalibacillus uzonensis]
MRHERLYDVSENANVRFVGFASDRARYDFGLVFTNQFFGKPLVICMQTGRSTLLSADEAENVEYLQRTFNISSCEEAEQLSVFFQHAIPRMTVEPEHE